MEDYDFFVRDREFFCRRLDALVALRGMAVVSEWHAKVSAGDIEAVVRELLLKHYDPGYAASIQRNFRRFGQARPVVLADRSPASMARAARELTA